MLANASLSSSSHLFAFDSRSRASMSALPWQHVSPKPASYLSTQDTSSSSWQPTSSSWPIDPQYSIYNSIRPEHHSSTNLASSSDFPESSQRTVLNSSLSPSGLPLPIGSPYASSHGSHRTIPSPPTDPRFLQDTSLYTLDDDSDATLPAAARKASPFVKVEQEDQRADTFVFETSPPAMNTISFTATESQVPLRATQASKEMRRMMGVFRLNPFAVQGGNGSLNVPLEEAKPLAEEGKIFEFQLTRDGLVTPESPSSHRQLSSPYDPTEDSWVDRGATPDSSGFAAADTVGWGYPLSTDVAGQHLLLAPASFDENASGSKVSRAPIDQRYSHSRGLLSPQHAETRSMRARRTSSDPAQGDALRRYIDSPGMSSRPTTAGSYSDGFETHDRYATSSGMPTSSFEGLSRHSSMSRRAMDNTGHTFFS
ncbi:hypothetical protein DENSPDRAFT_180253 [Dentipellis sp. KUC8613]|nr:hypothetical protein DENSPDRAFT_180253 [Dentipellis sp. KUC8613]